MAIGTHVLHDQRRPPLGIVAAIGVARGPSPTRRHLGQALLVVPLLVLLMPLRLVGLRLGELPLRFRSGLRVFTRGMLPGGRPATCGHECDDDQGYGDQGDDNPGDNEGSLPRPVAALDDRKWVGHAVRDGAHHWWRVRGAPSQAGLEGKGHRSSVSGTGAGTGRRTEPIESPVSNSRIRRPPYDHQSGSICR